MIMPKDFRIIFSLGIHCDPFPFSVPKSMKLAMILYSSEDWILTKTSRGFDSSFLGIFSACSDSLLNLYEALLSLYSGD